ncbi:hypothetical protein HDV00_007447 [Rhizophlyctis rosea]|nr:hypothetical protein HDV00_007447 [Rhizophlyctis rosea]
MEDMDVENELLYSQNTRLKRVGDRREERREERRRKKEEEEKEKERLEAERKAAEEVDPEVAMYAELIRKAFADDEDEMLRENGRVSGVDEEAEEDGNEEGREEGDEGRDEESDEGEEEEGDERVEEEGDEEQVLELQEDQPEDERRIRVYWVDPNDQSICYRMDDPMEPLPWLQYEWDRSWI